MEVITSVPYPCPSCGHLTSGSIHGYCTWDCYDSDGRVEEAELQPA